MVRFIERLSAEETKKKYRDFKAPKQIAGTPEIPVLIPLDEELIPPNEALVFSPEVTNDLPGNETPFEQLSLAERLNYLVTTNPDAYERASVDRVRSVVMLETEHPEKRKPYRIFSSINDFILYYNLHPQWYGKKVSYIQHDLESGASYYQAFWKWLHKITKDKTKRKELKDLIFKDRQRVEWSHLKTIADWKKEFQKNQELQGKKIKEIQNDRDSGGISFYSGFIRWVQRKTANKQQRQELMYQVLQSQRNDWSSFVSIDDWEQKFRSHPEWQGKKIGEIINDKKTGGFAFYYALLKWARKNASNNEEREMLIRMILPDYKLYSTQKKQEVLNGALLYELHPELRQKILDRFLEFLKENPDTSVSILDFARDYLVKGTA